MRATTRMTPLKAPTTIPAIERPLSACVACLSWLFCRVVPVAAAKEEDEDEDVVELEEVEELDVANEVDVEEDFDDVVEGIMLVFVEEVLIDDLLIVELVRIVMKLVGIDIEVGLVVGIVILVAGKVILVVGKVIPVVGRLNVVGVVIGVVVGTNVPGTDAGGVH